MLLRSMAPDVLAVDEIGRPEDVESIAYASCCGCRVQILDGNGKPVRLPDS